MNPDTQAQNLVPTGAKDLSDLQKKNLWKPGVSANPRGRPKKGETWKDCVRRVLDEEQVNSLTGATRTVKEAIVREVRALALKRVKWAVEFLAERDEGKAGIVLELSQKRSPLENMSDEELTDLKAKLMGALEAKKVLKAENWAPVLPSKAVSEERED